MSRLLIEPLRSLHRLEGFSSGEERLDNWLVNRALPNQVLGHSRTFVLLDDQLVIGFYSLVAGQVRREEATSKLRRNAPDWIPVIILARLAISADRQGQGFGRLLVQDAVRRTQAAAVSVGVRGMLVHAKSANARDFYLAVGFEPSAGDGLTLMAALERLYTA